VAVKWTLVSTVIVSETVKLLDCVTTGSAGTIIGEISAANVFAGGTDEDIPLWSGMVDFGTATTLLGACAATTVEAGVTDSRCPAVSATAGRGATRHDKATAVAMRLRINNGTKSCIGQELGEPNRETGGTRPPAQRSEPRCGAPRHPPISIVAPPNRTSDIGHTRPAQPLLNRAIDMTVSVNIDHKD